MQNPIGVKIIFEEHGQQVRAKFTAEKEQQGYPSHLDGGVISTLLDAPTQIPVHSGVLAV